MDRLQGILGLITILGIAYAFSNNRKAINYRTVGLGLVLQIALALFVIWFPPGRELFAFLGKAVNELINFSNQGASFVFGSLIPPDITNVQDTVVDGVTITASFQAMHAKATGFIFAFQVLPAIIFVGSLAGIAYYTGLMQLIVKLVAKLMVLTMKTSGAESLYAVSTVFVGQSEAPLFIRPYLEKMTKSELNAIMTGGMSTIAGSVLFAYVAMLGPDLAPHVITASIMGAPAGLALSKILCPETEVPATASGAEISSEDKAGSLIEAISKGANDGMHLSLIVGAQLITFIALVATINGILNWLGGYCGDPTFSIQTILGWILGPIAWLIGVPWADAPMVGSLIGQKIVMNEFIAYTDLLNHMNLEPGTVGAFVSSKSKLLSTYALCGFANISSVGINIGCIGGLAPSRQSELAKLGFRALLGGAMASLMTASLVGIIS